MAPAPRRDGFLVLLQFRRKRRWGRHRQWRRRRQGIRHHFGLDFSGNSAINGNGGAIDSGDTRGTGTSPLGFQFVGNVAGRAGAVDNADNGSGTFTVYATPRFRIMSLHSTMAGPSTTPTGPERAPSASRAPRSRATRPSETAGRSTMPTTLAAGDAASCRLRHFGRILPTSTGVPSTVRTWAASGTIVLWASTFSRNSANNVYTGARGPGGGAVYLGETRGSLGRGQYFQRTVPFVWRVHGRTGATTSAEQHLPSGEAKRDVGHGATHLGPLAANGGPTKTAVPSKGNPAIGAIPYRTSVALDSQRITLCPTSDQRGKRRTRATRRCDAGSVQSSG